MSHFSTCLMFSDIDATIRLDSDAVFLTLTDKNNNSVSITLNPLQILALNKYLAIALSAVSVEDIIDCNFLGTLSVQILPDDFQANLNDNKELPLAAVS